MQLPLEIISMLANVLRILNKFDNYGIYFYLHEFVLYTTQVNDSMEKNTKWI